MILTIPMRLARGSLLLRLGLCAMAILPTGCYVGVGAPLLYSDDSARHHVYKLYPGPERPAPEIAIVEFAGAYYAQIDGLMVSSGEYQKVALLPGEHEIRWGKWFAVSVLVDPDMFSKGGLTAKVKLEAGHSYQLHADRTHGHGYRKYFWITDAATGNVVAGEKKP